MMVPGPVTPVTAPDGLVRLPAAIGLTSVLVTKNGIKAFEFPWKEHSNTLDFVFADLIVLQLLLYG